jgi:hypothetical protein
MRFIFVLTVAMPNALGAHDPQQHQHPESGAHQPSTGGDVDEALLNENCRCR